MRTTIHTIVAAVILLATPTLAHAHAQLRRAEPPVGGTVRSPPAQVEITFNEAVEPRFSAIEITDASGVQMDKHDVHAVAGDAHRLAVSLGPLPVGVYKVVWRATAVDTHKTEGTFSFTVAP